MDSSLLSILFCTDLAACLFCSRACVSGTIAGQNVPSPLRVMGAWAGNALWAVRDGALEVYYTASMHGVLHADTKLHAEIAGSLPRSAVYVGPVDGKDEPVPEEDGRQREHMQTDLKPTKSDYAAIRAIERFPVILLSPFARPVRRPGLFVMRPRALLSPVESLATPSPACMCAHVCPWCPRMHYNQTNYHRLWAAEKHCNDELRSEIKASVEQLVASAKARASGDTSRLTLKNAKKVAAMGAHAKSSTAWQRQLHEWKYLGMAIAGGAMGLVTEDQVSMAVYALDHIVLPARSSVDCMAFYLRSDLEGTHGYGLQV